MHNYDIDAWEIECEKNIITIFPEYLRSNHVNEFIELVKKNYFSGKKLKLFCFKKEKDDTVYLGWVEEIREKKSGDNLPHQSQNKNKENLVENELKKDREDEGEKEESEFKSKKQDEKELSEKIKELQKEKTMLKRKIEEIEEKLKEGTNQKDAEKSKELEEAINQLRQELNQKEQKLEKLSLEQKQLIIKIT